MTTELKPDTAAAIDFLRRWSPDDDWCLVAIVPDGKTETRTFKPSEADEAADWIVAHQGKRNLYFTPNKVRRPMGVKPSKPDIAAFRALWADLDPRVGDDLTEERQRIEALLTTGLPAGIPEPSAVCFSGGGYQAFWLLTEPLAIATPTADNPEPWATGEAYNRGLERVFGSDAVHNCDRIMRLPGTINVPNKKKAAKGRKPELARVIAWTGATYAPEAFPKIEATDSGTPTASRTASPRPGLGDGAAVPARMGTEELRAWAERNGKYHDALAEPDPKPGMLSDYTLALIATGDDPIYPGTYDDRSKGVMRVCCDLVRAGVPDEMIVATLLDRDNLISGHIYDQKTGRPKYAARQVERAHNAVEKAEAERNEARGNVGEDAGSLLDELNNHHAVITSGKVRVLSWRCTHPELDREAPDLQSFEDFRNRYRNRRVTVGFNANGQPIEKPVGNWWLDHPQRREVRGICFVPGKEPEINGFQNLWRGWGVEPKPGGDWSLMRDHVLYLCGGSDFGLKWMADAVQNPDRPAGVAWVLRGNRGTGKGILGRALVQMFGQHGLQITSAKHLTGDFNLHLRDCCLLFADEVVTQGDKRAEAVLKGLITEDTLTIEGKGQDIQTAPNYLHIFMASNEGWVVPAGVDERRFAVFDVPDDHKQDRDYFAPIAAQLFKEGKNGVMVPGDGLAAMLYDLLHLDLGDWEPRWNIPQTEALARQKAESLSGVEAYIFDLLLSGELPPGAERLRSPGVLFVPSEALIEAARKWVHGRPGANHVTYNNMRELLASKLAAPKYRKGGGGANGYLWRLTDLRRAWDECASLFPWSNWPPEPDDYYETPAPSPF